MNNRGPVVTMIFVILSYLSLIVSGNAVNYYLIEHFTNDNWFYVGGSGPNNYTSIQDAIDNASSGDTVFVYNGTYYENIIISKSIDLKGENELTTIIDGGFVGYVIYITAHYVNLSRFTIINSGSWMDYCGVKLEIDCNYCNIDKNVIKENLMGIVIKSDFNTISNNNITYNERIGVDLSRCLSNIIQGNTISNVDWGIDALNVMSCHIRKNNISLNNASIRFTESFNNTFLENTFSYNEMSVIFLCSSLNTIKKNNFIGNNKFHVYFETCFNRWIQNYWDDNLVLRFKPIFGELYFEWEINPWEDPIEISIPWIQFDWHPAKEPYDI